MAIMYPLQFCINCYRKKKKEKKKKEVGWACETTSVFRMLPVVFPVGVVMSSHSAMAALATRWLVFVALACC